MNDLLENLKSLGFNKLADLAQENPGATTQLSQLVKQAQKINTVGRPINQLVPLESELRVVQVKRGFVVEQQQTDAMGERMWTRLSFLSANESVDYRGDSIPSWVFCLVERLFDHEKEIKGKGIYGEVP